MIDYMNVPDVDPPPSVLQLRAEADASHLFHEVAAQAGGGEAALQPQDDVDTAADLRGYSEILRYRYYQ